MSDVNTKPPSLHREFEYGADRGALRLLRFGVPSHESGDGVTVWGSTFVPTSGDAKAHAFDRLFSFLAFRLARLFCAGLGCFSSTCCASSVDSGEIVAILTRRLLKFGGAAPVSGLFMGLCFGFGGRFFLSELHF